MPLPKGGGFFALCGLLNQGGHVYVGQTCGAVGMEGGLARLAVSNARIAAA